jgi:hypothetical protein
MRHERDTTFRVRFCQPRLSWANVAIVIQLTKVMARAKKAGISSAFGPVHG